MKTIQSMAWLSARACFRTLILAAGMIAGPGCRSEAESVAFSWPTNGQTVLSLANLAGNARTTNTIQQLVFSIYDQALGQWWNGTNYQSGQVWLPTTVNGTNWTPSAKVVLPGVCCGQFYQLAAQLTDSSNQVAATNITVQANAIPPTVAFSPLVSGQTVPNLSAIGGSVTDNVGVVASVMFEIQELDINGGAGRWWNGTNFQGAATLLPAVFSANHWLPAVSLALPALNSGQAYQLTVTATDTTSNSASAAITVTNLMTTLSWDPGLTPGGTVVLSNPNTNGGNYWFEITPPTPAVGVWRTALNVPRGQAAVFMGEGSPPVIANSQFASANAGSNGFVLDASQFSAAQNWYILVSASTNAQWTLMTGDVFVYNLGSLATNNASSTNALIGAEGMVFYQTTVPSTTLAWQLWINGLTNQTYVKKSAAPDPVSYDLTQAGGMLVVPPYLATGTFNGTYFVGVSGAPGTAIHLGSRQQPITPLAFNSLTNVVVTATNFPYLTYEVPVPVQQIAWQLNLTPTTGNPSIAVRNALVPNEFRNDAFSEVPPGVGGSVSLVPPPANSGAGTPGLSDGMWYVTIYGSAPYSCGFSNANPVITTVNYTFNLTNDAPNRAGWRYYQVININNQLGTLGWALSLSNQAPGSEIAIRRNAVPGQWNYRSADDNYYSQSLGYVDLSSTYGLLQQPGHQADIWYIGVYTPAQALGNFILTGSQLTGKPVSFDGAGNTLSVTNSFPGEWRFFQITVPADTNLLGWDVRLTNVTAGSPQMAVCAGTLPVSLSDLPYYQWWFGSTSWPSGNQWPGGYDWTGCGGGPMLEMGIGNPLQPGTYYVGVQDANNTNSYTLESRGIGLTNYTIKVKNLAFTGSATNLALPVGEADYYQVAVPNNAPDWKLHLQAVTGDALMLVQAGVLPFSQVPSPSNSEDSYGDIYGAMGGQAMKKPGDEQWALLPQTGNSSVTPGTYYVLVAGQGTNLVNNCEGVGASSYTLSSSSESPVVLPDTLSYGHDLLLTNSQAGGDTEFYQFQVPAGIASIQVSLAVQAGDPTMFLNSGTNLVGPGVYPGYYSGYGYGNDGGTNSALGYSGSLITVANPGGAYSLSVFGADDGSGTYPSASYVLQIHAVPPTVVAFDGGAASITNEPPGTWQFFQITVPVDTNLLGWDVRLTNVTAGSPQMVVCAGALPVSLSALPYYQWWFGSTSWPSGNQWPAGYDWTGCGGGPMLEMGIGNPLQPGTYYLGVQDPNNTNSYTLTSRGIGLTNYTIKVKSLAFTGSVTNQQLCVGQADYYQVVVTNNAPDWKLHLQAVTGDALMLVQAGVLPFSQVPSPSNGGESYGDVYGAMGGQAMKKPGDEQWALLPQTGNSSVTPGTYYVLVAGQGTNLVNNCEGAGTSSYTLTSSAESPVVLPDTLSYGNDLLLTNSQAGGATEFYQFQVPAGIASIQVSLAVQAGNPTMFLNSGTNLVGPGVYPGYYSGYGYGNDGGTNSALGYSGSLITVANPGGAYSLSVFGADDGSGTYPGAHYVLQVHAAPPPAVAFDGGRFAVTNQLPGVWQFFQITVPADTNLLGWDVRLTNVTAGSPQMVVCAGTLPVSMSALPYYQWWLGSTSWPSGNQWPGGRDWTGCGGGPMLEMGIGNPLQPGTYYLGVQDPNNTNSYTLTSRGIGLTNYTIKVKNLAFTGSATNMALPVGEADYYQVVVPDNAPDWKLHLHAVTGDALVVVQAGFLPFSQVPAPSSGGDSYGDVYGAMGGQAMKKPGDEQWALLPPSGSNSVTVGTYYVLVASQGQNLINGCEGTDTASYTLTSSSESPVVLPDTLSYGHDLLLTNSQAGGDTEFYQFHVPAGIASVEVALANRVGNPTMFLNSGASLVGPGVYPGYDSGYGYGNYGGANYPYTPDVWYNESLITIPNPLPGAYALSIYGAQDDTGDFADASYTLEVHASNPAPLSFSPELDSPGLTNVMPGTVADSQHSYYLVNVPAAVNGAPVLGWKLLLATQVGSPSVRVRPNLLPDNTCDTTAYASPVAIISAPYLTPGVWYVDVQGSGSTTYSLASTVITTNTLAHPLWIMPALGQTNTAPGLLLPLIGDSGVDTNGHAILDPQTGTVTDQGIDLQQGNFDYYAVVIPTNNAGLLRTELQAISGNPKLYLRVGNAPTLTHYPEGSCDYWDGQLVDRQLTAGATEYGNWVPMNGLYESQLTNGLWLLAVQAGGSANARYRLLLDCGNPVTNGLVQNLKLGGGGYTNQNLDGGDWRYYRVQIPDPAPANWNLTWSSTLGSASMFIRDTVPPGDGSYPNPTDYEQSTYNPGPGSVDLQTWNSDDKDQGPYPRFDTPGTATLTTPPLRPGAVYYVAFWSPDDATFSVNSSTNGAVNVANSLPLGGGSLAGTIPGNGSLIYRLNVPAGATSLALNASNSTDLVLSLEQGTIALAGGPADWTSYLYNDPVYGNQANASFSQSLTTGYWPWLSGYTYYLTVTNISASAESFNATVTVPVVVGIGLGSVQPAFSNHGFFLEINGPVGASYTVAASTDLVTWLPITNFVSTNSPAYFYDPAATNFAHRYYRVQ